MSSIEQGRNRQEALEFNQLIDRIVNRVRFWQCVSGVLLLALVVQWLGS